MGAKRGVAALTATLLATACGHSGGPRISTAADPCTGILGCTEVAQVDVTGDGDLDRVGYAISGASDGGKLIQVEIAHGQSVDAMTLASPGVVPTVNDKPSPYVGAFRISRKSVADLVFHTQVGAGSSEQFVVLQWVDGHAVYVESPPPATNGSNNVTWYMQSSEGGHDWVSCGDGASITYHHQYAPTSEGMSQPGGGTRKDDEYTFDTNRWVLGESKQIPDPRYSYTLNPHTDTFRCQDQSNR